jgi:hypothetical protein
MAEILTDEMRAERRYLLDQGNRWKKRAEELDALDDGQDGEDDLGIDRALSEAWEQRDAFTARYSAWLPGVPVARCPFSGDLVKWPMDIVDLDGWYWNDAAPVRRLPALPAKWLAMTGAMRIQEPVTYAPFTASPGPAAPYVVPRLLEIPDIRAVISQVPVGRHIGWAISYFGALPGVELENTWGSENYYVYGDDGEWRGWDSNAPWPPDWDFTLAPWVAAGKLLWIAPGDTTATLRQDVETCPYLGISGSHDLAHIRSGVLRYR